MQCDFVNPLREVQWNTWVQEQSNATVFHTAQWAQVLVDSYGYHPIYAVFRDAEKIAGLLPIIEVQSVWTGRRGVSLPFSDECAPLLSDAVKLPVLLEPVRAFGLERRWDYLELRGAGNDVPFAKQSDDFVSHNLALETSEEDQFSKLRDSTRRNIQKALRDGVEIRHEQTRNAMDIFYSLHCKTRRRHGVPPQPIRFFHRIHTLLIEAGLGFVSLASFQGEWIAGAVYFRFGSRSVYKFGASDLKYQHLRANNLVMWKAICELQKAGSTELSLGRTERYETGLLQFKRGWGAREISLPYHRIGMRKEPRIRESQAPNSMSKVSRAVIHFLPMPALRLLGSVLYRHVG
jgi:lipid II:glycine glycyltransferase (peptidoglycan interpeptide bridge formation enzyme)